nr:hypothetical protein [Chlamydiota bacterium]
MSEKALQEAFALFSKETARLEKSYHSLKGEYQKLHEKLESIVTHISEGLVFVTVEGTLSIFNRAAADLLDLSQKDILGKSYSDIFSDTFFGFSMREGLKQSKHSLLTLNHNDRELEISTSFVPEKGLLLLLRDVTDLR